MPKTFSLKYISIFLFAIIPGIFGCKSTAGVSIQGANQTVEEVPDPEFTTEDSLEFVRILREKESEILDYRESFPKDIEVLHVELELGFDYQNQSVSGIARLLISPHFYPIKRFELDAKDFELGRISKIVGEDTLKLGYTYTDAERITIYLPEKIQKEDSIWVEINYRAFPERSSKAGSSAITDTKGLYFIDPLDTIPNKPTMIWTQGETEHNSRWFPMVDKPNQRFTQKFILTVPDSLISLSNGELISQNDLGNGMRQDTWVMDIPHAPYLAAVAVGDFGKVSDLWEGVPLGYYVEKGFENGAKKVFENTPAMIEFFSELLGVDFPWSKYDQLVVRDFVSGAMENTTLSIFMEDLRLNAREAIDSEWDYIIAHELFHQWFGDYVTTESWSNLTLNEAFANYSEYLWNEHFYSRDEADLKLMAEKEGYFYEAETKQVDLIRFKYEDSEDMFDSHSYAKGGAILHMLRKAIGDEAFFESLKHYLKENALKSVEAHDLRLAIEEVTGRDMNWFFNQWFFDKGHPKLLIRADYSQPENILLEVYQTQDLSTTPIYKIPFEVSWYVEGERRSKRFVLERAFQQFALENEDPVEVVYFDEQKELLAITNPSFSPEQWSLQFFQSEYGVSRYEALDSLEISGREDLWQQAVKAGLSDDFSSIQEASLLTLMSKDSWFQDIPELEELVFSIATNSKDNSVKSTALDVLAAQWNEKYNPTFRLMLNHPSYLVAGSALMGLMASETKPMSLEEVESYEIEESYHMIIPVAEYYLDNAVTGKGPWFMEKVRSLSGDGLYYFFGYFGEYFSMNPDEGEEEAILYLLSLMENSPKTGEKLGAFQALLGFADKPEVVEEMQRISGKESDDFLKQYYGYFLNNL